MAKVLVLYYSSWGHMEQMAKAAAEGAREAGADVTIKRVRELVPEAVAKAAYYKLDQEAPIAEPLELADYDAIIVGASTRFGAMASQLKNFLGPDRPASSTKSSTRRWMAARCSSARRLLSSVLMSGWSIFLPRFFTSARRLLSLLVAYNARRG